MILLKKYWQETSKGVKILVNVSTVNTTNQYVEECKNIYFSLFYYFFLNTIFLYLIMFTFQKRYKS